MIENVRREKPMKWCENMTFFNQKNRIFPNKIRLKKKFKSSFF